MGHSVHPRPHQGAIGYEKTAVRQVARARRPSVQPYRRDDIGRHVGAGRGRRPSTSRRIAANSRRGIATSASWNVTYRPCRTIFAPILTSFSRGVVSDQCSTFFGKARVRSRLYPDAIASATKHEVVSVPFTPKRNAETVGDLLLRALYAKVQGGPGWRPAPPSRTRTSGRSQKARSSIHGALYSLASSKSLPLAMSWLMAVFTKNKISVSCLFIAQATMFLL